MELQRRADGEAALVIDGREIAVLLVSDATTAEFSTLIAQIETALAPTDQTPRVVLQFDEGLLGAVLADQRLEVVVVEHDPNDHPENTLRRRHPAPDPKAVAAAIDLAERRASISAASPAVPGKPA